MAPSRVTNFICELSVATQIGMVPHPVKTSALHISVSPGCPGPVASEMGAGDGTPFHHKGVGGRSGFICGSNRSEVRQGPRLLTVLMRLDEFSRNPNNK